MDHKVEILPLTEQLFKIYIEVGTIAYNQHYLHLWKNSDSAPYISSSFTQDVLQKEEQDANTELYLVKNGNISIGVLKLDLDASLDSYGKKEAILLDKIYLLKEYSGKGIGKKVLDFTENRARQLGKKIIWLDTMKTGSALQFYLKNGFEIYSETKLIFREAIESERPMYIMAKKI
mgnify:CR=1 FL=1